MHVHHGLRGQEADRDLNFVRALAEQLALPFHFRRVDARSHARKQKLSLEESARNLRYQALAEVLNERNCHKIATGHTSNDQAETVIDHFLRGSGPAGLSGIPLQRDRIIRPLLEFDRNQIRSYATVEKLSYCEDSTNRELAHKRNRIRRELIPYLTRQFNSNLVETMNRTAKVFGEVETYLQQEAKNAFKSLVSLQRKNEIVLEIEGFLTYNRLIRKYIIFHCLDRLAPSRKLLDFKKLDSVLSIIKRKEVGKEFKLSDSHIVQIDHDGIAFYQAFDPPPHSIEVNFLAQKSINFLDYHFEWSILEQDRAPDFVRDHNIELFDFDRTGNALTLTTVKPGMRFVPLNFEGKKKVATLLSDLKVPHRQRARIPILAAKDAIVWICGYQIDDRFKITEKTQTVLKVELTEIADA